jgi:hypothetical protein
MISEARRKSLAESRGTREREEGEVERGKKEAEGG